jgi:outer membrane protein OmpA-like peptidoglycan-associated protein
MAATAADLDEAGVTARQVARRAILESLQQNDKSYRFDFVVTYLPPGTLQGVDFEVPVTHVRYDSSLFFAFDRDDLLPGADRIIRDFAGVLGKDDALRSVLIVGHTDSVGPDIYNVDLSERRARNVFKRLRALGVDENALGIVPMGEAQPVATNSTAAGRAANRRVEFFVSDLMEASLEAATRVTFDPCFRNDHGATDAGARAPCDATGEQVRILIGPDAETRSPTRIVEVGRRAALDPAPAPVSRPPIPPPLRQRPPLHVFRPSAE